MKPFPHYLLPVAIINLIFLLSNMDSKHISPIKNCVNLLTVNGWSVHLYQQITCYWILVMELSNEELYYRDRFSPDTFSFPPWNQRIFPLLSSQSRTRWKGSIQRSLSVAAAPQNRSGSVTESRYRSPWGSRDNSEFQYPGEGRVVRHRCGTESARILKAARLPRRLKKVRNRTRDRVRVLRQLWATVMLNPADPEDR